MFGSKLFLDLRMDYGFVDHKAALLSIALLGSFKPATINSAKSSGCKTLSSEPLLAMPSSIDMSDTMVLGVKVQTLILFLRTSFIKDSDIPITVNFDAEYAEVFAFPFYPAVDETLIISPLF